MSFIATDHHSVSGAAAGKGREKIGGEGRDPAAARKVGADDADLGRAGISLSRKAWHGRRPSMENQKRAGTRIVPAAPSNHHSWIDTRIWRSRRPLQDKARTRLVFRLREWLGLGLYRTNLFFEKHRRGTLHARLPRFSTSATSRAGWREPGMAAGGRVGIATARSDDLVMMRYPCITARARVARRGGRRSDCRRRGGYRGRSAGGR